MNTTPVSLLERLKRPDDQEAWSRFVDLYTPLLCAWAKRAGLQQQDAADLIQDVFTLLVKKLPDFTLDPTKKFRDWLRTVTLNKWHENHRRGDLLQKGKGQPLQDIAESDVAAEFWEKEYQQHLIQQAMELIRNRFQPVTWRAFTECVVKGRAVNEVASELGITANVVYISKSRVLTHLRKELEGLLD